MPSIGPIELIVLLIVFAVLLGGTFLAVRLISRAWKAGPSQQVRDLEERVKDLERRS
ncbi:hypothetical protein LAJ19_18275 (plasmid) [Deinococcus taeanensis]|uniref:hypothetical protein n=1 Tax=Deinococcus taeanensis TaxID=2737050 RepID=UPI001CDC04A5|nr:hypothetical protein [Deinococcus taeanensis]UBV45071.1 hypothetical protein LAJ19_18275 [Deinococcus taeanensis]